MSQRPCISHNAGLKSEQEAPDEPIGEFSRPEFKTIIRRSYLAIRIRVNPCKSVVTKPCPITARSHSIRISYGSTSLTTGHSEQISFFATVNSEISSKQSHKLNLLLEESNMKLRISSLIFEKASLRRRISSLKCDGVSLICRKANMKCLGANMKRDKAYMNISSAYWKHRISYMKR